MSENVEPLSFGSGPGTAIVTHSLVALIDAGLQTPAVDAIRRAAEAGTGVDELLGELAALGFGQLPSLAIIEWEAEVCRLVVRGSVTAELADAAGGSPVVVDGSGVHTWAEHLLTDATDIVLRSDETDDRPFSVVIGVVPAGSIQARRPPTPEAQPEPAADPEAPETDDAPSDSVEEMSTQADVIEPAERDEASAEADQSEAPVDEIGNEMNAALEGDETEPEATPDDSSSTIVAVEETGGPQDHEKRHEVDVDELPDSAAVDEPPADLQDEPDDDDGAYDHLFGATQFRSVEQAAVRPGDDHDGPTPSPAPPSPPPSGPTASTFAPPAPPAPTPSSAHGASPDHDGMTITVSELRRLVAAESGDVIEAVPGGPQPATAPAAPPPPPNASPNGAHLAVQCPTGHLNPPHAMACRSCGRPITAEPLRVDSIELGQFRFSTGAVVPVVGPLLIGRSPKVTSESTNSFPELVSVPSPGQDISRTHVEIRVEGWQVLVVDRGSTNGTVITIPGRQPQRLRAGEPFPLPVGGVVSLADEVEFTFEVSE